MIVYEATKGDFVDSVFSGSITGEIYEIYHIFLAEDVYYDYLYVSLL